MIKRFILLFFILNNFFAVFSQESYITNSSNNDSHLEHQLKLSFNIISFDFSYDRAITEKVISSLGIGIGAGFYILENPFIDRETGLSLSFQKLLPLRIIQRNRFYYNRLKRLEKNRSIKNNSGNYIGLQFLFNTGQKTVTDIKNPPHNTLLTELHWGIQRSLGGKWIFDTYIGMGYLRDYDSKLGTFIPTIGLSFGYNFIN